MRVWIADTGNEIKLKQSCGLTCLKQQFDVLQKCCNFFFAFALSCFPKSRGMYPNKDLPNDNGAIGNEQSLPDAVALAL